jgi:serine/threonine protein kinase
VANAKVSRSDPLIGTRLGDYTIKALIGRGGMARVYEGLDDRLGRRAAIKVIEAHHEHANEIRQRFVREARAVANLDHPNLVSIYQFGEDNGLYYMAMKYIEGKTLLSVLRGLRHSRKFMEPQRVTSIITEVSAALDYAHSQNIIHRDIKPSNIMLSTDDHAVLTDFGLTMQLGVDSTLGTAFGTPRYIAPEQAISSQRAVPQSDIYSLGIVLYEMAVGQAPFDDDSPMTLALSHITSVPPQPTSVRPDLPHAVQTVILKALEKRPEHRWQTGTAMADALRNAYIGIEPNVVLMQQPLEVPQSMQGTIIPRPAPSPVEHTTMMPERALPRKKAARPSRAFRLLLALLMLLVVGFGVYSFLPKSPALNSLPPDAPTDPRVRLIYSREAFFIYNATNQPINLENVSFVRNDPAGVAYEAAQLGDRIHRALPPHQCLRIKMRSFDDKAQPLVCGVQNAPRIYDRADIIFWAMRGDTDSISTFLVKRGDQVLQTCSMRLNTCEFPLP